MSNERTSITIKVCCGHGFHNCELSLSSSGSLTIIFNPCDALPNQAKFLINEPTCHTAIDRAIEAVQLQLATTNSSRPIATAQIIQGLEQEILDRVSTTRRVAIMENLVSPDDSTSVIIDWYCWMRSFKYPWSLFADTLASRLTTRIGQDPSERIPEESVRKLLQRPDCDDRLLQAIQSRVGRNSDAKQPLL